MIMLGTIGLVTAYVVLALLLLFACLYATWGWTAKSILIVLVSTFYLVTYFSFPPLMGWPTDSPLPERFNVVALYVQEPDKKNSTEGTVFLWITDLDIDPRISTPRAHKLPFTESLHAKVVEASNKLKKGLPQLGEIIEEEAGPAAVPEDGREGGQKSIAIEFFDLPDPLFPEK